MCGKNSDATKMHKSKLGSPPRVREKRRFFQLNQEVFGITPACAGKTSLLFSTCAYKQDHPRVCGKNCVIKSGDTASVGSPPRVREKLSAKSDGNFTARITPACAGKTGWLSVCHWLCWDHPRVCGKNFHSGLSKTGASGSPPRVREKH